MKLSTNWIKNAFALCGVLALGLPAMARTVTTTADSGAGSLRQAIADAAPGEIINFTVTGTIVLESGELVVNKNLTISGPGANRLTLLLSHYSQGRLLHVTSGTLYLSGLTLSGGDMNFRGGSGGGILNESALFLTYCTLSNNKAEIGGGLTNHQSASVRNCTFMGNVADGGNPYATGGAIFNTGSLGVWNSTFDSNTATSGGGVGNIGNGSFTLLSCTLTQNRATNGFGGGVFTNPGTPSGRANVQNSIIAQNTASESGGLDLSGPFTSLGHNFIGASDGGNNFVNGANNDRVGTEFAPLNPKLGPLRDNGGPTLTLAPLVGSPVINTGDSSVYPANGETDQRGGVRKVGASVDIGAVEYGAGLGFVVTNLNDNGPGSLRQVIMDANLGNRITFAPGLRGTITLTTGELFINKKLAIVGTDAARLTISGNNLTRVFEIRSAPVYIGNVSIINGKLDNSVGNSGLGGAMKIWDGAAVTLNRCMLSNNQGELGGAILNYGNLAMTNCTVSGNSANNSEPNSLSVGGVLCNLGGIVSIQGGYFTSNVATSASGSQGGAIFNGGTMTINGAHFYRNTVAGDGYNFGGGICNDGVMQLAGCTFDGNRALWSGPDYPNYVKGAGGGIANIGTSVLNVGGCVFTNNSAGLGGGFYNASVVGTTRFDGLLPAVIRSCTFGGNSAASGGGLNNPGWMLLENSVIVSNSAASGGGISISDGTPTSSPDPSSHYPTLSDGTLTMNNCQVSGNSVSSALFSGGNNHTFGGGIFDGGFGRGPVKLQNSTIAGNSVTAPNAWGGGVYGGPMTISNCTISGNKVTSSNGLGGGIYGRGITLSNSTVSGNMAAGSEPGDGNGGGIYSTGNFSLLNCTVTANTAGTGGGIYSVSSSTKSGNTIVAGNMGYFLVGGTTSTFSDDVHGAFASQGHNLVGVVDGSTGFSNGANGDQTGTRSAPLDPKLGPLADNGGPTQTHALLPGSPAIGGGDDALAPATDQRGVARYGISDIGSYVFAGRPTTLAKAAARSAVTLSTVTASGTTVQLAFSGALNPQVAADVTHYALTGSTAQSASYNSATNMVTLRLTPALRSGATVAVAWRGLVDGSGKVVADGSASATVR